MKNFFLLIFYLLFLTPGISRSEEIKLVPTEFRSSSECFTVLAEFNWVCAEFESQNWTKVYGYPFWERGVVASYKSDLDGDGYIDIILRINHVSECGNSGCALRFIFGGVERPKRLWAYKVPNSPENIYLRVYDGGRNLRLGSNWIIGPISKIKTASLKSSQVGLE